MIARKAVLVNNFVALLATSFLNKGMNIKTRIRELRWENAESQESLAKTLHTTKTAISHWENGKNEPDINSLILMADHFHCSLDYLLGATENKTAKDAAISEEEKKLIAKDNLVISNVGELSDYEKQQIIAFADFLKSGHQKT